MIAIRQEIGVRLRGSIRASSAGPTDGELLVAAMTELSRAAKEPDGFPSSFSDRTLTCLAVDILRLRARRLGASSSTSPSSRRLNLGCGSRKLPGWLNVDLVGSDCDWDLACGRLPWQDGHFEAVLAQHLVEHLELDGELIPLLRELHRVCASGAEVWLSCPDLERVTAAYASDRGRALLDDKLRRCPRYRASRASNLPSQQVINLYFHQAGQHKNLFDFELLDFALREAGFVKVERMRATDLAVRFSEVPPRNDDVQALCVRAVR